MIRPDEDYPSVRSYQLHVCRTLVDSPSISLRLGVINCMSAGHQQTIPASRYAWELSTGRQSQHLAMLRNYQPADSPSLLLCLGIINQQTVPAFRYACELLTSRQSQHLAVLGNYLPADSPSILLCLGVINQQRVPASCYAWEYQPVDSPSILLFLGI